MLEDLGGAGSRHGEVAAPQASHGAQERIAGEVLGQVARRTVPNRLQQVAAVRRDGEHHDPRFRQTGRQLTDGLDAAHAGQVDIKEQEIRP